MIKKIEFEQFNRAEVMSIGLDESVRCALLIVTVDEQGNETETYRENNISFDKGCYAFELTEEDKNILNTPQNTEYDTIL